MPITSPGNDDDTGENHQPTLRKNTAEPVEQTLKQNMVALSVLDPANLSGSAIAWPDAPAGAGKPARRIGATVVLNAQGALLYAAAKAKHLTAFDQSVGHEAAVNDSDEQMRKAATELAYALKRNGTGSVTFSDINGEPLNARHPFARILHQSGFTPVPQGMRLY